MVAMHSTLDEMIVPSWTAAGGRPGRRWYDHHLAQDRARPHGAGHFESAGQDIVMSGYLGSIGFALPAALGCWAAIGGTRKVVSISGDGGLGQYLADFTTAVKYGMGITHMNNDELGKISREQAGVRNPVWQTSLVNPDFARYAELCGGRGWRVDDPGDLRAALTEAIATTDVPSLVEVRVSARDT